MTRVQQEAVLLACDLFRALPKPDIGALARCCAELSLPAGRSVIRKGDACDALYIVEHGAVRGFMSSAAGKELNVFIFGRGMAVNAVDLADRCGTLFHAMTLEATSLLRLPYAAIDRVVDRAHLHSTMLRYQCGQMRYLAEALENIAMQPLDVRVARMIHRLHFLSQTNPAVRLHRLDQSTIAALVNGTRPRVNAQLQKLRRLGAIDIQAGVVVVCSLEVLSGAAQLG